MLSINFFFSLLTRTSITKAIAFLMLVVLALCASTNDSRAEPGQQNSKRVEVYSLSQNYWDTQNGDTLGAIVLHLLPNNPAKYQALRQDIVHLNPHAFVNGNPELLLTGKRLWLPGYMKQADSEADPETTRVERYSWGNIKRPRD